MLAELLAAVIGAAIGSFLNVIIHRVPRDESVAFPGSHCPDCGHALRPLDNIPIVGWILLRGRCRYCHTDISLRYPLVELMTVAVFVLAVLEFGVSLAALAAALLGAFLIVTVFIDIDHLLIVDAVTIPVAAAGLVLALAMHRAVPALEGALLGAVIFGLIYTVTRGTGMGLGDVKLAACLGIYLGLSGSIAAFAAAFIIGTLIALPVLLLRRRRQGDVLPFGPFLVLGALVMTFMPALIYGPYAAYQQFVYRHLGGG